MNVSRGGMNHLTSWKKILVDRFFEERQEQCESGEVIT
jgi:hypothetical protein